MNTEEHSEKHEGIANEFDHISDRIVKGEDTDSDLLKRIEALEREVRSLKEQHLREIS